MNYYKRSRHCAFHVAVDPSGTIVFKTLSSKRLGEWLAVNNSPK